VTRAGGRGEPEFRNEDGIHETPLHVCRRATEGSALMSRHRGEAPLDFARP
jgi:hypothetical protein